MSKTIVFFLAISYLWKGWTAIEHPLMLGTQLTILMHHPFQRREKACQVSHILHLMRWQSSSKDISSVAHLSVHLHHASKTLTLTKFCSFPILFGVIHRASKTLTLTNICSFPISFEVILNFQVSCLFLLKAVVFCFLHKIPAAALNSTAVLMSREAIDKILKTAIDVLQKALQT